ncbi:WecB/TagA/CpsF family glycosyltransferase [Methyloversatilis sp. XJ19-49]|uniref:WecB/TagA/CpsF family glycosyltransferase n=1 Tax=Methyloversatilis sp. XJ19-49 TaxID=2963429 RepID=UPI00211CE8BD|nr:WecB/TagA/CpsF family glycosyltransferase [Methyloversatilis sp. XJ19-49]MCQ9380190.1 WecB/TagA/CpsF family glycosyltransferase [Methyloversatilis sp. XJ19-49]
MTRRTGSVLGVPIDIVSMNDAAHTILDWASRRESRYVTICNAHVVVTATEDPAYGRIISCSDMATPDGAPVAWVLRKTADPTQRRVCGPDLTWLLCTRARAENVPVYFYGGSETTLSRLEDNLRMQLPEIPLAGFESPPFRPLSEDEDENVVARINASGAGIVFVGLGCPKQERWMAAHRGRVNAVMIGVGAAFDFHAGTVKRAPKIFQSLGLEWLHRLCSEPRRLWKRYLVTNTLFVIGALRQLLRS